MIGYSGATHNRRKPLAFQWWCFEELYDVTFITIDGCAKAPLNPLNSRRRVKLIVAE